MSKMMDRRTFSTTLAAGVVGSLLGTQASRAASAVRNVVLVHGLYADGSSWSECIVRLQAAGLNVTAVQNPLTSFADDVAATRRALAMQDGPTVLAAHSYGGMVATQAGDASNVTALVYVAARAPDAGENYTALAKRFSLPPASAGLVTFDGFSRQRGRELYAVQASNAATLSATARTTVAAWRLKPSWYAVSKQDRTINPDLERFMAARMKATTIEIDAGHLSLVSRAPEVTSLILQAAGQAS
jgi:pimeloyl-ACP methyl ester carboxylesterase